MGVHQVLCTCVQQSASWACGTPNRGNSCISDSFPPIELPCPALMGGTSPCLVSCFVPFDCQLLEASSFLKQKWRESGSGGKGMWEQSSEEWREGSSGQDVLYERKLYFQEKEKEKRNDFRIKSINSQPLG